MRSDDDKPQDVVLCHDVEETSEPVEANVIAWRASSNSFEYAPNGQGDLALLQIKNGHSKKLSPVVLDGDSPPFCQVSAPGASSKHPGDHLGHARIVFNERPDGWIQLESIEGRLPIERGFSGAPVYLEERASVCGMISFVSPRHGAGFMIPASILRSFITEELQLKLPLPLGCLYGFPTVRRIIGRRNYTNRLRQLLKEDKHSSRRVWVLGERGVGKTALAADFCSADVIRSFYPDGLIFLRADSDQTPESIMRALSIFLNVKHRGGLSEAAIYGIRQRLEGRKILIVIDNVTLLDSVRDISRITNVDILITSCHKDLARLSNDRFIELECLSKKYSQELFLQESGVVQGQVKPKPVDMLAASRIVDRLGIQGLPLALVMAGSLVKAKVFTLDKLEAALEKKGLRLLRKDLLDYRGPSAIIEVIRLSIKSLPFCSFRNPRTRYSEVCVFQESAIPVKDLIAFWVSAGLMENDARAFLNILIQRYLLSWESQPHSQCVRVHDLIWEYLQSLNVVNKLTHGRLVKSYKRIYQSLPPMETVEGGHYFYLYFLKHAHLSKNHSLVTRLNFDLEWHRQRSDCLGAGQLSRGLVGKTKEIESLQSALKEAATVLDIHPRQLAAQVLLRLDPNWGKGVQRLISQARALHPIIEPLWPSLAGLPKSKPYKTPFKLRPPDITAEGDICFVAIDRTNRWCVTDAGHLFDLKNRIVQESPKVMSHWVVAVINATMSIHHWTKRQIKTILSDKDSSLATERSSFLTYFGKSEEGLFLLDRDVSFPFPIFINGSDELAKPPLKAECAVDRTGSYVLMVDKELRVVQIDLEKRTANSLHQFSQWEASDYAIGMDENHEVVSLARFNSDKDSLRLDWLDVASGFIEFLEFERFSQEIQTLILRQFPQIESYELCKAKKCYDLWCSPDGGSIFLNSDRFLFLVKRHRRNNRYELSLKKIFQYAEGEQEDFIHAGKFSSKGTFFSFLARRENGSTFFRFNVRREAMKFRKELPDTIYNDALIFDDGRSLALSGMEVKVYENVQECHAETNEIGVGGSHVAHIDIDNNGNLFWATYDGRLYEASNSQRNDVRLALCTRWIDSILNDPSKSAQDFASFQFAISAIEYVTYVLTSAGLVKLDKEKRVQRHWRVRGRPKKIAISPNGKWIFGTLSSWNSGHNIFFIDSAQDQVHYVEAGGMVDYIQVTDTPLIVLGYQAGGICSFILECSKFRLVKVLESADYAVTRGVAVNQVGTRYLMLSGAPMVTFVDMNAGITNRSTIAIKRGATDGAGVAISATGKLGVIHARLGGIDLIDLANSRIIESLDFEFDLGNQTLASDSVAISPNGQFFAFGDEKGRVHVTRINNVG
jgi:hypothetical protein